MKQAISLEILLGKLKAGVWDYDGVHYDYATLPAMAAFDDVHSEVTLRLIPGLDRETARSIAADGYRQYGDCVGGIVQWAIENGRDAAAIRDQIFKGYHSALFNRIVRDFPDNINAHAPTIVAFQRCAAVMQHGVATHSSVEHWAKPFLKRQKLLPFFNESALVGLDDVGYATKNKSITAIHRALEALQANSDEAFFAEDSLGNLEYAHANIPGLVTIYIHHGKPLKILPAHVSAQFKNPEMLMQAIARTHGLN